MIQVDSAPRRPWIPFLTLFAALILLVLPMQELPGGFVPDWVSLVLIYWALAFPVRMGVPIAWATGLIVDIITLGIPGAHAFTKSVIVYITGSLALRIRAFPIWQQSVVVFLLLSLELASLVIISGLTGEAITGMHRWTAVVVGALVWPLIYHVLRRSRHSSNLRGS